ncbi:MAG TPA: hypothetical protein VFY14_07185 [Streptomyces sp.]|nr:hypothetical protein [Streptomyces sp.]
MRTWVASGVGLVLLGAVAGTLWYVNAQDGLDEAELRAVSMEAADSVAGREVRRHSYRAISDAVRGAVEEAARQRGLPVPHVGISDTESRLEEPGGYLMTYHFQLTDEQSGRQVCLVLHEREPRVDHAAFEPHITVGECAVRKARY